LQENNVKFEHQRFLYVIEP